MTLPRPFFLTGSDPAKCWGRQKVGMEAARRPAFVSQQALESLIIPSCIEHPPDPIPDTSSSLTHREVRVTA